jgi:hypothetical protein
LIDYSLLISLGSILISFTTLFFNLYKSTTHLHIEQIEEKYSGTILKYSDYLPRADVNDECMKNGNYTACILIDLLIVNNSSNPITIKSFSSKNTLAMDSTVHTYGVQAGIGDEYDSKMPYKAVIFKGSELFVLPLTIGPYDSVQKRVQIFVTNDYAEKLIKCNKSEIKLHINVTRNILFKKIRYIKKIRIKPFKNLAKDNTKHSSKEENFMSSYGTKCTSGDGILIDPRYILNRWLHDR